MNRAWPEFETSWTPLRAERTALGPERLVEIPVRGMLEHPVWPPPAGREPGPDVEHPVWPPEGSQGDLRILLADGAAADEPPEVVRRVEPDTAGAGRRAAGADGLVVVRALVGRDGTVSEPSIARSVPALDDAALRAVRRWRFRPALRAGRPAPATVYVPVKFAPR